MKLCDCTNQTIDVKAVELVAELALFRDVFGLTLQHTEAEI